MAYFVAVGSSDGINIDLKFGEVGEFLIYRVDGKNYELEEKRAVTDTQGEASKCESSGCSTGGCQGNKNGCGGAQGAALKVESIADCRCVICTKIGFQAQKQFERKAISVFDVTCSIEEALDKIAGYYEKTDNHKSLRSV